MKKELYDFMIDKIRDGFVLRVSSYGRLLFCDKKHIKLFENDKGQDFYVGKQCICPAGVGLAMATNKECYYFNALKNEWIKRI